MNLISKIEWLLNNSDTDLFINYTDKDWLNLETEIISMINNCSDGIMLQECLTLDVNYIIPYDIRLSLHKRLTEIQPANEKAIRDYAFYLNAFGDEPEEIKAAEMLKKLENKK
jgi:hypothetical protein